MMYDDLGHTVSSLMEAETQSSQSLISTLYQSIRYGSVCHIFLSVFIGTQWAH